MSQLCFTYPILPLELPAFKMAVTDFLGGNNEVDGNTFGIKTRLRYPLIQFKLKQTEKGHIPLILALGNQSAYCSVLEREGRGVRIHTRGKAYMLDAGKATLTTGSIETSHKYFCYNLFNYLPSFAAEKANEHSTKLLHKELANDLARFVEGVGGELEDKPEVQQLCLKKSQSVIFRKKKRYCYNLSFKSNLYLPELIGLGLHADLGFGIVRHQ